MISNGRNVRAVAITGMGAVTAYGPGTLALWKGIETGVSAITSIARFSTKGFSVGSAALVPNIEVLRQQVASERAEVAIATASNVTADLALLFARIAIKEALHSANLLSRMPAKNRIAFTFGTSLATHPEGIYRLAEILANEVGAHGPRITISTACASSANAIGLGRDLLLSDVADVVIAGGADALTEEIFAGFHNLGLLAPEKCAPFSEPFGTTLGEGAGFLILERSPAPCSGRPQTSFENGPQSAFFNDSGAPIPLGWISGYGLSCDAYHATSPDPTGAGIARAIQAALADAHLAPALIDYVNAHGTGTEANDPAEWRGIVTILQDHPFLVSGSKSLFGHGQGAAGVLELIATLLAMSRGAVPQTLHHTRPRPRCPIDPVAQKQPRPHHVAHALCNSSAFGGANAIVVLDHQNQTAERCVVRKRKVRLLGGGLLLPGFSSAKALSERSPSEVISGRICSLPNAKALATVDLRGFDPLSRYLTFATADALQNAGVSLKGSARDRAGLFVALTRISPTSAHELDNSVKERGLLRLSAPAFTRVVLNASTGACSRALQLRGPTSTMAVGHGGSLIALYLAVRHLSEREDADVLCVASADEADPNDSNETFSEAAGCLVLCAEPTFPAANQTQSNWVTPLYEKSAVEVIGWGIAGPGEVSLAIARANEMAGIGETPLHSIAAPQTPLGPKFLAPASAPLIEAILAFEHLARRSEPPPTNEPPHTIAWVLSAETESSATAIILAPKVDPAWLFGQRDIAHECH